jgi:RHS repeat-associated protein
VEELTSVNGGATTLSRVYTYGNNLISQWQSGGSSGTTFYYGYDGHGNVRFLLDGTGAITDTYTYDAFGVLLDKTGSTANNYLYCGEQYDFELGTYYLRARYMNPGTGRFWTMDTFQGRTEDPLSLHKYLYCDGNPVNYIDPDGHLGLDLSISTTISAGLQGFSDIGTAVGERALIRTIGKAVGKYILKTAIGVAAGTVIGLALLDHIMTDQEQEDEKAYVVRGGEPKASNIKKSVGPSRTPGVTGFSVQSAPGQTIRQLAQAGDFPNNKIGVATVATVEAAGGAFGYFTPVTPTPGIGFHCTVQSPNPMPDELANALSTVFKQMDNPAPRPK